MGSVGGSRSLCLIYHVCTHRKVFFTDYGQIPKVERCDMDGQNRTKLVDSKIVFPHGITLDLVSRLVYWADAYLDYIEVVDYEGKGRQTIIQGILVRGLCLRLFWGDHPPDSLLTGDLWGN